MNKLLLYTRYFIVSGFVVLTLSGCVYNTFVDCKIIINEPINDWNLKYCNHLSGGPSSLEVAGIGLEGRAHTSFE